MVEEKSNLHESNLQITKDSNLEELVKWPQKAPSNLLWFENVHLYELDEENRTYLRVDDLYAKSQDVSNKHILEVDDLCTNSQDGYNNNSLEFDELYTKSQDEDNQHFHTLIYFTKVNNEDVISWGW